jgi:NAD(P)H-dependent FMN reductase
MSTPILALVGSLRAGSYNHQLAEAAIKHAPEGIEVYIYEGLADVPFYNQDLDQPIAVPPSANALRSAVRSADALLLVAPKYNGTIRATLKNAIDWISRPYPSDAIVDKPKQRRHVMKISHATNACAPAMESHLITGGSNGLRGVTAGGQLRSHVCRSRVGADAGRRRSLGRASRRALFDSDVVRVGDLGVDRRGVVGPGVVVDGVRGRVPCGVVDRSRTGNR